MDRLNQLRNEAGGSRDSTLDTSSPLSEAYLTANDSSKYFSLLEDEANFITKDIDNPMPDAAVAQVSHLMSNLSPKPKKKIDLDSYDIGEQIEAANILSGGVEIFDDNDNSYDGDELVIDDNIAEVETGEDRSNLEQQQNIEQHTQETSGTSEDIVTPIVVDVGPARPSKDTEVLLQIDGKNVDAIDIGNGLYLYRREGEEDLAAVQILDNTKQHSNFKFLKVRENADGNLEVYEEIEVEVPAREGQSSDNMSVVPTNEANRVANEPVSIAGTSSQQMEAPASLVLVDSNIESQSELRPEVNLNGRMMKFNESRKSPVVGSYTPMTFHSTPNKEGIPLTKTMVNQQLHPSRHSDNVKKTIEVHTDQAKQRILETPVKSKPDLPDVTKIAEIGVIQKEQNETMGQMSEEIQKTEPDQAIVNQKDVKVEELCNKTKSVEDAVERFAEINKPISVDIKEDNINKEIGTINENKNENLEANVKTNDLVSQNEDNDFSQCIVNKNLDSPENIESIENKVEHMGNNSKDLQNDLAIVNSAPECEDRNIPVETELNIKENMDVSINKNVSYINNKSETKLNEGKKLSIANVPVNKINETQLKELDKKKDGNIGNVLDVDKMNKISLEKINEDKNSCIASGKHIKEISEVDLNKTNKDQNNSVGNITNLNKTSDTDPKENKNITFDNVPNVNEVSVTLADSKEEKNTSIRNVPDIQKITETNLKNLSEDNILVTENVIDVNKVSEAKTEDATNTTGEVPEVNEISEAKVNERNKETIVNIIGQISSKTIVHCNLESVETSNSIKNVNENLNLDKKNIKSFSENKTFESSNVTKTMNIPSSNVSIPKNEVNDSTSNNVNHIFSKKGNTSIDTLKTKSIDVQNVRSHENSSRSVNPLNIDKSPLTSGKQITFSKDIPLSNKDIVNPSIDVTKNEEQASEVKSAACHVSNKITSNLKTDTKKDITKINKGLETKPAVDNNKAAVPFGKWTEANRQEFLNKIKEIKIPTSNSNTKQIKQPNDLNRRDILQKIDSQRQQQTNNAMAKVQEQQKLNKKNEANAFVKSPARNDSKIPVKERPMSKPKTMITKKITKDETLPSHPSELPSAVANSNAVKKELTQRREINNQDLIDKTIEDIINRTPSAKPSNEEPIQNVQNTEGIEKQKGMTLFGPSYHTKNEQSVTLDDIEMKMNELHGIPFVERPTTHQLPQGFVVDSKLQSQINDNHTNKGSNLLQSVKKSQLQTSSEEVLNIDSDDEIIEHEPITGDINHKTKASEVTEKPKEEVETSQVKKRDRNEQTAKKDVIITEKDFDKFFRRNSVTYENCLTVNFDGKEPHNVIQTIVEKEVAPKKLTRNEVLLAESKAKSTQKQQLLQARHSSQPTKMQNTMKYHTSEEDSYCKNYQSKLQIAYQSALTAKRQKESPITIIEDKPVKVVFMESNVDFLPCQLNVQGEKVSQTNKLTLDLESLTQSTTDSLDSDILDSFDAKSQDDGKTKSKHQRKQVLTPVDIPEMELIEPSDLGIEISPKKKRKLEDKMDKSPKNHVPKKSYLLGRTTTDDKTKMPDMGKISFKEITNRNNSFGGQLNSISAIDNLVKAAELLENQSDSNSSSVKTPDSDSQHSTPAKRGRGRPRKYPLADGDTDKVKVPSPQKKPRLIDAKLIKRKETTDNDDDDTSDDEIIRENWTMGKINENIVCPICGKLFRSENVVFKHVKHCTGPSPNRSESDKRRSRESQESIETRSQSSKFDDMDIEEHELKTPKKRKSKEIISKVQTISDEVIVIEDTPLKEKPEKHHESRKSTVKSKIVAKPNNSLVCEICDKSFRQASYLAHHKLSHKNEELKRQKSESNAVKSVFSCEVCKKEFRKLHHLVQHRIIHNSNAAPSRTLRKSSSEQGDGKIVKEQSGPKPSEDLSAGFRCEPCDKSFRKLHHLVEHRETHDGINRQKATEVDSVKPTPMHQCNICYKTFKKLQLLNEHKELHLDTCSEKSDDKSVKSSLSTKDIIHECSLCYMVFPNEHSLNKHTVICLRKKKQSAAKAKQAAENKEIQQESADLENPKSEEYDPNDKDDLHIILEDNTNPEIIATEEIKLEDDESAVVQSLTPITKGNCENAAKELKDKKFSDPVKPVDPAKKSFESKDKELVKTSTANKDSNPSSLMPKKVKHADTVAKKSQNTAALKKKFPTKEKVAANVMKRQKTVNVPLPVIDGVKATSESSDDDEIRYMLNPNFREVETTEIKNFIKVKSTKRNSLQIERPTSKDLVKRRISLQHPLKISRLKTKAMEQKSNAPTTSVLKALSSIIEKPETDPAPSTDSDDSDVKYSFPVTLDENSVNEVIADKKPQKRKSLAAKRKSLAGVGKKKSLGKMINFKHKVKNTPPPKQVKKRTTEVEHRCDCGRMFSSAALLSRHTTLDHTPPRIRRRRSPQPATKLGPRSERARPSTQGPDPKPSVAMRKASNAPVELKADVPPLKRPPVGPKGRRSAPQKAPAPEKVRKLVDKFRS